MPPGRQIVHEPGTGLNDAPPIKRLAFAHQAVISLKGGDPNAIGSAVTMELCGALEHDGDCRWPHNNIELHSDSDDITFRTIFLAPESEERHVRLLIRLALRSSSEWVVLSDRTDSVSPEERALARRLRRTSHQNSVRLAQLVANELG